MFQKTKDQAKKWKDKFKNTQKQLDISQATNQNLQTQLQAILNDWDKRIKNVQTEKDKVQQTLNQTQQERDSAIKERDTYQTQLTDQEQKIVQQLNNSLKLGLDKEEKDLNKAIVEIQRLISKDPLITTVDNPTLQEELGQAQQTIVRLERELEEQIILRTKEQVKKEEEQNKEKSSEEFLPQIKQELINNLDVSSFPKIKQQIEQSTNYQQAISAYRQSIKAFSEQNIVTKKNKELVQRNILISCLVVSLPTIWWLLYKAKKNHQKKP
ncbi:MAG: hypothetical protein MRECE_8c047 [Mycoplasmataceae bacterium CE_OT135]|nr:MAG: hypothetical protein MRECE_8c047 [Mycoplasmataceae bacterium CE_OT135]